MLALASIFTALAAWIVLGDVDAASSDGRPGPEPADNSDPANLLDPYQSMLDMLVEEETTGEPTAAQGGAAGAETIGASQGDTILAQSSDDIIAGSDGDDLIIGAADGGTIEGGSGDDILTGVAAAKDQASGITDLVGDAHHELIGGDGNDSIMAGAGDIAIGGAGNDAFFLDGTPSGSNSLVEIADFDPDEDQIIVCLPTDEEDLAQTWPERPTFSGEVVVEQTDPGGKYSVTVDDVLIASVQSSQPFDSSNVSVIYDGMIGPSLFDIQHGYF